MLFAEYPYQNFSDYNLDFCIKKVKELWVDVHSLNTWKDEHQEEYNELKRLYDDIMSGNFPESMLESLHDWLNKNALSIIGELATSVFFELSDMGYFVAYIPDSWKEINFRTTEYDIEVDHFDEFGHLVLMY